MAEDFGTSLSKGLETGFNLGLKQKANALAERKLKLDGLEAVHGMLKEFDSIADLPSSVRGPIVKSMSARMEAITGRPMEQAIFDTFMKGNEEELKLITQGWLKRFGEAGINFDPAEAFAMVSGQKPAEATKLLAATFKDMSAQQTESKLSDVMTGLTASGKPAAPAGEAAPDQMAMAGSKPDKAQPQVDPLQPQVDALQAQLQQLEMARDRALTIGTDSGRSLATRLESQIKVIQDRLDTELKDKRSQLDNSITPAIREALKAKGIDYRNATPQQIREAQGADDSRTVRRKGEEAYTETINKNRGELNSGLTPEQAAKTGLPVGTPVQSMIGKRQPTVEQVAEYRRNEIATRSFLKVAGDVQKLVYNREDSLGAIGALTRGIENMRSQVVAAARLGGIEITASVNPETYKEELNKFSAAGITSARARAAIVNLAYASAAADGQVGRAVSDNEIKQRLNELGAASGSSQTLIAVIQDFKERIAEKYATMGEVYTGERPGDDILQGWGRASPVPLPNSAEPREPDAPKEPKAESPELTPKERRELEQYRASQKRR